MKTSAGTLVAVTPKRGLDDFLFLVVSIGHNIQHILYSTAEKFEARLADCATEKLIKSKVVPKTHPKT